MFLIQCQFRRTFNCFQSNFDNAHKRRGGRIYPTLTAISPTPTLHLVRFKASGLLLQTNTLALQVNFLLHHIIFYNCCYLLRAWSFIIIVYFQNIFVFCFHLAKFQNCNIFLCPAVTDVETTVDIAAVNEAAAAHQAVTVAVGDGHGGDREEDAETQEEAAIAVVSLTS